MSSKSLIHQPTGARGGHAGRPSCLWTSKLIVLSDVGEGMSGAVRVAFLGSSAGKAGLGQAGGAIEAATHQPVLRCLANVGARACCLNIQHLMQDPGTRRYAHLVFERS